MRPATAIPAVPFRHPYTQTWREISAVLGDSEEARATTTVPAERGRQTETDVGIGLPDGYGSAADAHHISQPPRTRAERAVRALLIR
jgi:hypothetical protein